MDKDLALLHQKIDALTEQFEAQRKRQETLDELRDDLIPVANHLIRLSIEELADIDGDFRLEDILFLLKRLLRSTPLLLEMLDRLGALSTLADEASLLGREVFASAVETLDRLEREGYFAFGREAWHIVERVVAEFSEEDVRALGDNVVTILTTVRNMTQPDVMSLANEAVDAIRNEDTASKNGHSAWALLREMNDPQVRKGLARMLQLVKVLAERPSAPPLN